MPVTFPNASTYGVHAFRAELERREVKASTEVRHTGDAKADTLRTKDGRKPGWQLFGGFRAHRRMTADVMARQVAVALNGGRSLGDRLVRELLQVPPDPKFSRPVVAGHWTLAAALTDLVANLHRRTGLPLDDCLTLCRQACEASGRQADAHHPTGYVQWLSGQVDTLVAQAFAGRADAAPVAAAASGAGSAPHSPAAPLPNALADASPRPSPSTDKRTSTAPTPVRGDEPQDSVFGEWEQSSAGREFQTPVPAGPMGPRTSAPVAWDFERARPLSPASPEPLVPRQLALDAALESPAPAAGDVVRLHVPPVKTPQ